MTTDPSRAANADLARLADRMMELGFEIEPLEATLTGVRTRDAELADLSVEGQARHAATRAAIRAETAIIDPATLNEQDALTRAVILALADYGDAADAAEALEYTAAAFPVSPSSILLAYVRMVVVTNADEAAAYLERLRQIPRYLSQAEHRLAAGRDKGLLPVAHLVQSAVDQIEMFLDASPNPLAIEPPADWEGARAWREEVDDVIEAVVRPAFVAHRDHLVTHVLPTGRSIDEVGLVHLPGGRERYLGLVRYHTTTERTPEELHQVGLEIVASIHEEFIALGTEIFGLDDVHEIFAHLNSDPVLRWNSSQEILDAAETAVRRAETVAPQWFGRLPEAVCALEAIPDLEAEGAPAAYYMPPAIDGSRPGTYYTNVDKPTERTIYDLESVAFHEAVPGHHFQIALALETPDLPMLRRVSFFTAYVEGWGLYSERLADEMGLYSSPLQRIGMLSADAWRASRLVVDTGMHAMGWSRQQAVDYLLENTPVVLIEVEAEIDRYIAMPGQALAYMTGRLEIESLRALAEESLGDRFDIKAFHDRVLEVGALPLAVLAQAVADWVEAN
jgi:uncharacterized protein (DUF885 family)